jgi:hypothetical protein
MEEVFFDVILSKGRQKMRLIWILVVFFVSITIITGCSEDNEKMVYPKIVISLAPGEAKVDITKVVITVFGPDIELQEFIFNADGNKATGIIIIPKGRNRLFIARAYSANDIEYEGELFVENLEESSSALNLHLEPAKLAMKIFPSGTKAIVNGVFQVNIELQKVVDLFGCSFVLEYDPNILESLEVVDGGFLGNDVLFITKNDSGRLSVGITRKAGMGGVKGYGVVARVKFRALKTGDTELKIIKNDDFEISKEDGTNIDGFDGITIKNLKVSVR